MAKASAGSHEDTTGSARSEPAAGPVATRGVEPVPVRVRVPEKLRPRRPVGELLRVQEGFSLAAVDPRSTPGFEGDKTLGSRAVAAYAPELGEWQERLFAETKVNGTRSLVVVVQGMDTSGKGGIMRHVASAVDPHGLRATAFKAPTAQERRRHFLWRIRRALPQPGQIAVFDRSHYEDVLIARVNALVSSEVIEERYAQINAFEQELVVGGTGVVKVMLHVSKEEQKARLRARLLRPDKRYKYSPGDIDERRQWEDYQGAYELAVTRCSTADAPWFVVPADRKWYARYAVQQLMLEKLRDMNPQWPVMGFDVPAELQRLAGS